MRRGLAVVVLCGSCGRYAGFELPGPGGGAPPVKVRWDVAPEPSLVRGPAGEWDSVDALNPSVAARAGLLWNLYSGYDGKTWHTGAAVSRDGVAWEKRGKVLSPSGWEGGYLAANGSALWEGGELRYWYQAGDPPRIALASSAGGVSWRKHGAEVLPLGPYGSWDERGVADPYVIREGEWLYMYFLGQDRARRQRLGVARSRDGIVWDKHRANPVLETGEDGAFDENGLGEPAVWKQHGRWWMLYTGRDRAEYRRIGLAWSSDGVKWRRFDESAVFAGARPWNRKVVCDPSVEVAPDGSVRVWYGGGDVAHPAENIHGQIGLAILRWEAP